MIRACPRASIGSSPSSTRLRRDCPWDREQSFETLKTYLLEETYETLAALDEGLAEPLERRARGSPVPGLLSRAPRARSGAGSTSTPSRTRITRKMTERHPHVFGGPPAESAEEVKRAWEKRKRRRPGRDRGSAGQRFPPRCRRSRPPTDRPTAPPTSASTGSATPTWPRRSRRSSPSGGRPRRRATAGEELTRSAICCSRSSTSRAAGRSTPRAPCVWPTGGSGNDSRRSRASAREAGEGRLGDAGWRSWTRTGRRRRGS